MRARRSPRTRPTRPVAPFRSSLASWVVRLERARLRARRVQVPSLLPTGLCVLLWVLLQPLLTAVTSTFRYYPVAYVTGWAIAATAALAAHLWPTWTAPWRTLAWAWICMAMVGSTALTAGWGQWSLTLAAAAALVVIAARANQNARRVADLVRRRRSTGRSLS